ncbi:hypothetical protein IMZ08_02180 [Bacillus luteolus]|uniref:Uncharacterized protein n=1 Tax=Litchfieldia luteola TaxID=682179 RepID=A0ABR9QED9_9BACI|nr:hypothetical protein [Cytobacillus luteolus]MBE4906865.1 hypothetical protein [Cytobacillus luteolus]MBP1940480.1 uncharacterized protein YneF (UPF0154 family) [Cytobacillus luteolus]
MNIKLLLLSGIFIDFFLALYLFTMIDEIGVGMFAFIVAVLFGGTIFFYFTIKRNQQTIK